MHQRARIDGATTDGELAAAFAARAPGALEEAYLRHVDILYAIARSVLGATGEAQDCVHDAVLRVWQAQHSYRVERGALRSFLIVCVRNEALSRRRNTARRAAIEQRELRLSIDTAEPFEDVDHVMHARLRDALETLPREQRAVIELAYAGERTQTEIAAQLGLPLGTVKSRVSLGLRKLAMALGPSE
jgi:RNA polymerase sigma-70 factor (ECF subfamily)